MIAPRPRGSAGDEHEDNGPVFDPYQQPIDPYATWGGEPPESDDED